MRSEMLHHIAKELVKATMKLGKYQMGFVAVKLASLFGVDLGEK